MKESQIAFIDESLEVLSDREKSIGVHSPGGEQCVEHCLIEHVLEDIVGSCHRFVAEILLNQGSQCLPGLSQKTHEIDAVVGECKLQSEDTDKQGEQKEPGQMR